MSWREKKKKKKKKVFTGLENVTWRWTAGQWMKRRVKSDNWHVPFKRILRFVYLSTRFFRWCMYFRIVLCQLTVYGLVRKGNSWRWPDSFQIVILERRCVIFYDCIPSVLLYIKSKSKNITLFSPLVLSFYSNMNIIKSVNYDSENCNSFCYS